MFARFRQAALAALIPLALVAGLAGAAPSRTVARKAPACSVAKAHHAHVSKACARTLAADSRRRKAAAAKARARAKAKVKAHPKAKAKAHPKAKTLPRPTTKTTLTEGPAPKSAPAPVTTVTATGTITTAPAPTPAAASIPQLFSPTSIWNAAVPAGAALDPSSSSAVAALSNEAASEFTRRTGPWIATTSSSTPILMASASQPTVKVWLDDPTANWRSGLAAAFSAVPIPSGARPAAGPDGHMTVWQQSTDRLWEFYHAHKDAGGTWHAAWGGAINHVSTDPGYYSSTSWANSGASWGATASSLPVAGGVLRVAELKAGRVDHALAMNIPSARGGVWAWPAQRTDGRNGSATSLPEGAHLRLDPKLDLSKLDLRPLVRTLAVAAQKYGIVVRDQTGWAIGLYAEDPLDGANPYEGKSGIFGGTPPNFLMAKFPWSHLQLLKMDLRSH